MNTNGHTGHDPLPVRRTRHIEFIDLADSTNWGREYTIDANGRRIQPPTDNDLIIGASMLTARHVGNLRRTVYDLLAEVRAARAAATRKPPTGETPAEAKRRRERESRRRAMEAYTRAGGVGTDDEDDGPEPMAVPPGVPPLAEWRLSVRARKAINRLNITTPAQLVAKTADDLLMCKNFGQTSLAEVRERLAAFGLRLAGDPDPTRHPRAGD